MKPWKNNKVSHQFSFQEQSQLIPSSQQIFPPEKSRMLQAWKMANFPLLPAWME
jgi:hypothetical protein